MPAFLLQKLHLLRILLFLWRKRIILIIRLNSLEFGNYVQGDWFTRVRWVIGYPISMLGGRVCKISSSTSMNLHDNRILQHSSSVVCEPRFMMSLVPVCERSPTSSIRESPMSRSSPKPPSMWPEAAPLFFPRKLDRTCTTLSLHPPAAEHFGHANHLSCVTKRHTLQTLTLINTHLVLLKVPNHFDLLVLPSTLVPGTTDKHGYKLFMIVEEAFEHPAFLKAFN